MNTDAEKFYKLITKTRKELKLTADDVMFILNHCGYNAKLYDTYFPSGTVRWSKKTQFINDLENDGVVYFAYVKFYKENSRSYALVAGKTKVTATYHTDIHFTKDEKFKGKAKKWLRTKDFDWDTEKIFVVVPKNKNDEQEALDIEREITGLLGLYSS